LIEREPFEWELRLRRVPPLLRLRHRADAGYLAQLAHLVKI
jgi:hypothetical protein